MRSFKAYSTSLVAVLGVLITAGTGPDTVRVSGAFAGEHQLQAVLYATFAPDLPNVLLSRRKLVTDAAGAFDATIPFAPAYFSGAIITVIVQTAAAVPLGSGSIILP